VRLHRNLITSNKGDFKMAGDMEQKYKDMAKIAVQKGHGIVLTTEMLIKVGCDYDLAMDITIEANY